MTVPKQAMAAPPITLQSNKKAAPRIKTPATGDQRWRMHNRLGHQWQQPTDGDDINGVMGDESMGTAEQQTPRFVLDDGFKSELGFPKDLQHLSDVDRVQQSGEENKQTSSSSQSDEENLLAVE